MTTYYEKYIELWQEAIDQVNDQYMQRDIEIEYDTLNECATLIRNHSINNDKLNFNQSATAAINTFKDPVQSQLKEVINTFINLCTKEQLSPDNVFKGARDRADDNMPPTIALGNRHETVSQKTIG